MSMTESTTDSDRNEPTKDNTTVEIQADLYDGSTRVSSDGRLWLGEDWAGKEVEIAIREK